MACGARTFERSATLSDRMCSSSPEEVPIWGLYRSLLRDEGIVWRRVSSCSPNETQQKKKTSKLLSLSPGEKCIQYFTFPRPSKRQESFSTFFFLSEALSKSSSSVSQLFTASFTPSQPNQHLKQHLHSSFFVRRTFKCYYKPFLAMVVFCDFGFFFSYSVTSAKSS